MRNVDLLLAEEFATNPQFAVQFRALTKFSGEAATVVDFWVSKSDRLGESDLVVLFQSEDGQRFALLIEDKVDAALQPDQAARYRLRADKEVAKGIYVDYAVVLCAPRFYLENHTDLHGFDHLISLEQIANMIRSHADPVRADYRAKFLETAGTRRTNAWIREDDAATNEFWDTAYELATREFPLLEMKPLRVTKGSVWITFRPHDFPTMPKHIYVSLKGHHGLADLTFTRTQAFNFQPAVAHLLQPDMSVHQTAAAAAIRIKISPFLVEDGIAENMPKVRTAFEACSMLIAFYRGARAELDKAAQAATPALQ
jgi:hypothetical protein